MVSVLWRTTRWRLRMWRPLTHWVDHHTHYQSSSTQGIVHVVYYESIKRKLKKFVYYESLKRRRRTAQVIYRVRKINFLFFLHVQQFFLQKNWEMGKKQASIASQAINRSHLSSNQQRNYKNKCNKKNILEKKAKHPARFLTTKPMYSSTRPLHIWTMLCLDTPRSCVRDNNRQKKSCLRANPWCVHMQVHRGERERGNSLRACERVTNFTDIFGAFWV